MKGLMWNNFKLTPCGEQLTLVKEETGQRKSLGEIKERNFGNMLWKIVPHMLPVITETCGI
jgi:hypothetical protein